MNKENKIPLIRFKGYTEDWEQRKLGEVYASIGNAFVGTATPYYVEQGHFYLESNNIKDGQINRNSEIFINDEFYEKQKDKWLHTGDIVMVQSGHVGHAAVIPEELDNSAAHALIMFRRPKENIEPYFLNYQYQTNKSKKKIEEITTGNTIKHILASDMQEFVVDLPNYPEQQKIGSYFQNLDNLITLHQRKCESLKKVKKSMLQKMFPKNGESVPEIRFAGFTDPWEQRKLGEVSSSYSGGTPTAGKSEYYDGNIPFIRSGEINEDKTELYISELGFNSSSAAMVEKGDILYALYGATSGEVSISQIKGAINQAILAIKPNDNYDSRFIMQWLRKQKQSIISTYLQGGQGNLSGNIVKSLKIDVTSLSEQQKIGSYFQSLDNLITLHQRKVEKLKEIKKSMLQKMFV